MSRESKHSKMGQEDSILMELSSLVNTLNSIEDVLTDIERLTSPESSSSVLAKQRLLLEELDKWKLMLKPSYLRERRGQRDN